MADQLSTGGWKPSDEALCYLDFLADDLFLGGESLDAPTLAAAAACSATAADLPGQARPAKRVKDDADVDDDALDDADDERSCERKGGSRMAITEAAKNKACREKARRERINGSFLELAKLVDPGKDPKTDKSSILSDAIKVIQQLRVENNQLKQLNKFLEERVSHYERSRSQQLFQLASMHQAPQAALAGVLPQAPGALAAQLVAGLPCAASTSAAAPLPAGLPGFGMGMPQQAGALPSEASTSAQAAAAQAGFLPKPLVLGGAHQPPPYWLPPSMLDSTQDSLLRPPAA